VDNDTTASFLPKKRYVINDMTEGLIERDQMRQSLDLAMEVQQNLLKGNGIALGVDEDWQYEINERIGLAKGHIIVLNTDGVWEAHNRTGEIFGKARLYEIIRQNATKKAEEIIEAVIAAVSQFQKDATIEDDITLVVIKIEEDLRTSDKKK
jgi:serine phosphatase RsbU (regulator of sigma subunit)